MAKIRKTAILVKFPPIISHNDAHEMIFGWSPDEMISGMEDNYPVVWAYRKTFFDKRITRFIKDGIVIEDGTEVNKRELVNKLTDVRKWVKETVHCHDEKTIEMTVTVSKPCSETQEPKQDPVSGIYEMLFRLEEEIQSLKKKNEELEKAFRKYRFEHMITTCPTPAPVNSRRALRNNRYRHNSDEEKDVKQQSSDEEP